jgi:hypothetical protein
MQEPTVGGFEPVAAVHIRSRKVISNNETTWFNYLPCENDLMSYRARAESQIYSDGQFPCDLPTNCKRINTLRSLVPLSYKIIILRLSVDRGNELPIILAQTPEVGNN